MLSFTLCLALVGTTAATPPAHPFNDASLPLEERLDDLMARLTRADLVHQLGGPQIPDNQRPDLYLPGSDDFGRECLSGVDSITIPENK